MTTPGVKFQRNPHFPVNTGQSCAARSSPGMDGLLPQYIDVMFFGKDRLRDVEEIVRLQSA
ncbi:MAG: hypothetical protein HY525_04215 [Betaproteobacteria bacterium]|nr:hypothetical protein [Betaproteobacteria bacterium]